MKGMGGGTATGLITRLPQSSQRQCGMIEEQCQQLSRKALIPKRQVMQELVIDDVSRWGIP
jgi:hypothetical protein